MRRGRGQPGHRRRVRLVPAGAEPRAGTTSAGWTGCWTCCTTAGIRVALATPTASPPPWFSLAHPDALPVTADGVRLTHGSRDTYCASAPAYRAAAGRIADRARPSGTPITRRWRCGTCTTSTAPRCHCDHAATRVPALAARPVRRPGRAQRGLDRPLLEPAATPTGRTSGHRGPPSTCPTRPRRWTSAGSCSDELRGRYTDQRDVLRAVRPDVPVTTNFVLGAWVPVDHWQLGARGRPRRDRPLPRRPDGRTGAEQAAFAADLARSLAAAGSRGTGVSQSAAGRKTGDPVPPVAAAASRGC